jgi:hypothetical protein
MENGGIADPSAAAFHGRRFLCYPEDGLGCVDDSRWARLGAPAGVGFVPGFLFQVFCARFSAPGSPCCPI